mmetsp:Transcript_13875/g.22994  ORF Transcript_13875/g.22994 Transcript_13875/m.22994 type:complete len:216 (+) Transcript_13875:85-732(+)|eukprot:CAMPEP_0119007864 /NCGR_PEP_ID=MMETSP1176-20130426/3310_1 /TAXON_ID=265551 /ORGANISM="Synedropsis recta cf, Strain CCMP1620" /LENGTH=215 /DNA_ID=CAMNT_0006960097 /DNA_START=62 /DNA_END=709 /DNA_ORIENTATION=-
MSIDDQAMESRLLALETRIGLAPKVDKSTETKEEGNDSAAPAAAADKDITSRLTMLEDEWKSCTTTTFNVLCSESDKLLEELQPGAGLTYQQALLGRSKDYPILYRQQLVLASQDSLRRDMAQLSDILNLITISQKTTTSTADLVTRAPILHTPPVTLEQERRLDTLRVSAAQSQRDTVELANRMDATITVYQKAMLALSDRMIRLEENIMAAQQ